MPHLDFSLPNLSLSEKPTLDRDSVKEQKEALSKIDFFSSYTQFLDHFNHYAAQPDDRLLEINRCLEDTIEIIFSVITQYPAKLLPDNATQFIEIKSVMALLEQLSLTCQHIIIEQLAENKPKVVEKYCFLLFDIAYLIQRCQAHIFLKPTPMFWENINQIILTLQHTIDFNAIYDSMFTVKLSLLEIFLLNHLFRAGNFIEIATSAQNRLPLYFPKLSEPFTITPIAENQSFRLFLKLSGNKGGTFVLPENSENFQQVDISQLVQLIRQDIEQISKQNKSAKFAETKSSNPHLLSRLKSIYLHLQPHERKEIRQTETPRPVQLSLGFQACYELLLDNAQETMPSELIDESKQGAKIQITSEHLNEALSIDHMIALEHNGDKTFYFIQRILRKSLTIIHIGLLKIEPPVAGTINTEARAKIKALYFNNNVLLYPTTEKILIDDEYTFVADNEETKTSFTIHAQHTKADYWHNEIIAKDPSKDTLLNFNKNSQSKNDITPGNVLLNTYLITDILGEGGMGKVYKLYHLNWNSELAVKIAKLDAVEQAGGLEIFEKEAETWINLGLHNHIVCCFYIRYVNHVPYLFSEYVDGGSLKDWISQKKCNSLKIVLDIAIQFAWGLQYAHQNNLIHRDIKPANVMLTAKGIVKVTDFGLALTGSIEGAEAPVAMTVIYCSPEQANQGPLTFKTDMWSWGLTILEMFKGAATWPYGMMAHAVLEGFLETENNEKPNVKMSDSVAKLLTQCFQSEPADRPESMAVIAQQLCIIYAKEIGNPYPRQTPNMSLDTPDSLNNRAVSYMDLNRLKEATALWKTGLNKQPNHLESLYNTGLIRWRTGKTTDDSLIRRLRGTQQSTAGSWVLHYIIAMIHLEQDNCRAALEQFTRLPKDIMDNENTTNLIDAAKQRLSDKRVRGLHASYKVEHLDKITCIDRMDDCFVTASNDGSVKFWRIHEKKSFASVVCHSSKQVLTVKISKNKKFMITGGVDDSAKQWDIDTLQLVHSLGHKHQVNCVDISPNDQLALSASHDQRISVWDTKSKHVISEYAKHSSHVLCAKFSPDNRFIISGDADGNLMLWDARKANTLRKINAHQGQVTDICWLPSGKHALSGGEDSLIILWDLKTGSLLRQYKGHTLSIRSFDITNDSNFMISAGEDNTLRLWHLKTAKCITTLEESENFNCVKISHDQLFAYTGGSEWLLKVWRTNFDETLSRAPYMLTNVVNSEGTIDALQTYTDAIVKTKISLKEGKAIDAYDQLRTARAQPGYGRNHEAITLWHQLYFRFSRIGLNKAWQGQTFITEHKISCLCLSLKNRYLLSGDQVGHIQVWDLEKNKRIRELIGHKRQINHIDISKDNRLAISASRDAQVKLWDLASGDCIDTLEAHEAPVTCVKFFKDGNYFVTASEDKTMKLWSMETKKMIQLFAGHSNYINTFDLTLDDDFILSGGGGMGGQGDDTAKLWQVSSGRCLITLNGHNNWLSDVSISPDGQTAVTCSQDRTIRIWNISTAKCLHIIKEASPITAVQITSDNKYLISASKDKTVKLWDLISAKLIQSFSGHEAVVNDVRISVDSRYVISAGEDRKIQVWIMDWNLKKQIKENWDWEAKPRLEAFLNRHTQYSTAIPDDIDPQYTNMRQYLSRTQKPEWQDEDVNDLYYQLGYSGMGWLKLAGIKRQLEKMLDRWEEAPRLVQESFVCPQCDSLYQRRPLCHNCGSEISSPKEA